MFTLAFWVGDCSAQSDSGPIWKSADFSLYRDRIVQQGGFVAKAISDTEMSSNFISAASQWKSSVISFKFSINGVDNEMPSGQNHQFHYLSATGMDSTPLIRFGHQFLDTTTMAPNSFLPAHAVLKFRVDMRKVLQEFKDQGYYTTYQGNRIYQRDFKGVFVAGDAAPLNWDFDNLAHHPEFQLREVHHSGIYEGTVVLNNSTELGKTSHHWKLSRNTTAFPQYHSDYPISDALYNLSLEEMQKAIEPDSTFRTGKEWAGVWTRDISYSIILSMAYLQPKVAQYSLLRKVDKNGKIIQDTGTGGAWPVSTDRMIWAVAAWKLYEVTGDTQWLRKVYTIIKKSNDADLYTILDKQTGLERGESSFLDWREQTYPKWMQPADIFDGECLGTNDVHYEANWVLSKMARQLHLPQEAAKYYQVAENIKAGINHYLWMPAKGYYGQYLYGRGFKILSPRSEALGEALAVDFGIADPAKQKKLIDSVPVTDFGISCIYPQIPGIPPYHNNAVWPFVQSYWLWAADRANNQRSVMESISDIYRPAALFLTNKENFVAGNGDFFGTQINSSNMLWSLSGNLSIILHVIFGIRFEPEGIRFSPDVPRPLQGKRSLLGFKYRKADFNIFLDGYGNQVKSFLLDGVAQSRFFIPATLTGHHTLHIELDDPDLPMGQIHQVTDQFSPATPAVKRSGQNLVWNSQPGILHYRVIKNGKRFLETPKCEISLPRLGYAQYQVIAVDSNGLESFASEPLAIYSPHRLQVFEVEKYAPAARFPYPGFSGTGFVEISTRENTHLKIPITISKEGLYTIDFRYANGNGPINTENKCAVRTLFLDGHQEGTYVFPQRGTAQWSNWGYSNSILLHLSKGVHQIQIINEPEDENMNITTNQAMLDQLRVIRIQ
ncbi:MAG: alpha-L-rhamnosidase-related protein [Chitinophagaceae bacterium]